MKITSSMEYATRLTVALAREGKPLTSQELSTSENVPVDYVNQLLLRLKRAGVLESHRGSGGGHALAKAPADITLSQVLRAVDGEIFEDVCEKYSGKRDCRHHGGCSISPVWQKLGALIEGYFDSITLAQLLEEQGKCGKVEAMLDKVEKTR